MTTVSIGTEGDQCLRPKREHASASRERCSSRHGCACACVLVGCVRVCTPVRVVVSCRDNYPDSGNYPGNKLF